jgi:uncharacterized alpha-E superfamily protein
MLSRVADCLYWMSRYLERAEHTARALDVQLNLALDEAPWTASEGWMCLLNGLRTDLPMETCADARAITHALVLDRANPSSVLSCIASARENARQIRESITSEMWEEINHLYLNIRSLTIDGLWSSGPHPLLRMIHRGGAFVAGVTDATMSHGDGWQFVRLGRFTERAMAVAWLLEAHFGIKDTHSPEEPASEQFVAWAGLLRTFAAFEPYCKVHTVELRPRRILQFLLLNEELPHSVRFASRQIEASIGGLRNHLGPGRSGELPRLAGRLAAQLSYTTIDEVMAGDLADYLRDIVSQCVAIHDAVYAGYLTYDVAAALGSAATGSP